MAQSRDCLFVGSVPFKDSETVFRRCTEALPDRLLVLPDGETGHRIQYTRFQLDIFPQYAISIFSGKGPSTPEDKAAVIKYFEETAIKTGYDDAALASYEVFKQLKSEGAIPAKTKFQVGLPTIANVVGAFVKPDLQKIVEPFYEKALFKALARIQEKIPHEELAIQLDMGMDLSYWEDLQMSESYWAHLPWHTWFDKRSYVVEYLTRMMKQVDEDVDLGLHFCYGDLDHKHFKEPESLASIVDLYTQIKASYPRKVEWVHAPVPLSANDKLDSYYAPLASLAPKLASDKTRLYLGLVHANDLAGTQRRIEAATKVVGDFGVATECGLGRTPQDEIDSILEIMRDVSAPA